MHDLHLTLALIDAFETIDCDKDGQLSQADAASLGPHFVEALRLSWDDLKLPAYQTGEYLNSTENIPIWMDEGLCGSITGGRPLLLPRPPDPYRSNMLEIAEVITYFNRLKISKHGKPCPILAESFKVSQYFSCIDVCD